ncbi:MAG: hypothetical protein MJZ66_09115 [Bacteroidales bacterium]|nr:hypothetical protein [Bacteroidales bacterium]
MKTTITRFLLMAWILLMPAWLKAQTNVTMPDSDELPKVLEEYMGVKSSKNEQYKKDVMTFLEKLRTKTISDNYRTKIVEIMNGFIKKRASTNPHMYYLIRAVNGFWNSGKVDQFDSWAQFLNGMVGERTTSMTRITEVTMFTTNLLEQNYIAGNEKTKVWYMNNNSFKINIKPDEEGENTIFVTFDKGDLRCKQNSDSTLAIYGTSGEFCFKSHTWKGKNGKVDWQRGNLSADSIYAELGAYEIDTKGGEVVAHNVDFYNKKYFSKPIKGDYNDKVVLNSTGEKARYPKFKSKDSNIEIKNLAKDIDYVGGYAQNGVLFNGQSVDSSQWAALVFKYKDEPLIKAEAQAIVFGLNKLEAQEAKVTIYLTKDKTITHPGLKVKYNSETEKLTLFKGNTGMENAYYNDNFHNLSIDINEIQWQHNDTTLYLLTRGAAKRKYATFESEYFYDEELYNQMMALDRTHPLVSLVKCEESVCCKEFSVKDLQRYFYEINQQSLSEVQVHQLLLQMSFNGYVDYNPYTRIATIKQKTYNYNANHAKKRDYDAIFIKTKVAEDKNKDIKSRPQGEEVEATINLNNKDLTIFYPDEFMISKARMVKVKPNQPIVIHEGLDMDISGKIEAGLTDFYGKRFQFDYDKFVINIPESDSMSMLTVNYDEATKREKIDSVKSVFENITGTLMIDEYNNKSGNKENTGLPKLVTRDTSHVYYDNLISGDYDRSKFYMEVYPFDLDSMNFLSMNGVHAKGKFVSNIFPDLDVTLTVQEDQSMGFELEAPPEGYELYNGKAKYFNKVTLNSQGLMGDGEIHYLTATAKADQFQFYPDLVFGDCNSMVIKPVNKSQIGQHPGVQEEYPDMESPKCQLLWKPHEDKFSSISRDTAIALYGKSVNFNGSIDLTPKGMFGNGELLYYGTGTFSEMFTLKNSTYMAKRATFCNFDSQHPGDKEGFFYTDKYDISTDFNTQKAEFVASSDTMNLHFPQHKYDQTTSFFEWNIGTNAYEFGHSLSTQKDRVVRTQDDFNKAKRELNGIKPLWGGVTMSSHKDTLTYGAYFSSFNNEENVLHVHEPGEIVVVDSRIDPSGIIDITLGGKISKFDNAVITASRDSLFHKIIGTTVSIRDKYYFKAVGGQYEYNGSNQGISYLDLDSMEIRRIKLDTAASAPKKLVSFGLGSVKEEQEFMLSPQFMFVGKYSYMGTTPGIKFNGFSFIKQTCDSTVQPFKFEGNINPDNVVFPISEKVIDQNKRRLYTGFYFNEDSLKIYPIFMGHKWNVKDSAVFHTGKGLTYNEEKREFRVAPRRRLNNEEQPENYAVLYKNLCDMYGEGDIQTNANLAPLKLTTKGEIYYKRDANQFSFNNMLALDFHIKNDVMKMMTDDINECYNLRPVTLNSAKIKKRLQFIVGDTVHKMLDDYALTGEVGKIPHSLQVPIVLADMQMYWDSASTSFKSSGEIGVAFINGTPVNKYMNGKVQIVHNRRRGDQITIFLQPTSTKWYYFNYNAGFMYCLSSNDEFNEKIIATKEKERVKKIDKLEYQYVIGAVENKSRFLRSFANDGSPALPDESERAKVNEDIEPEAPELDENGNIIENGGISTPKTDSNGGNEPAESEGDDSDFVLEQDSTPEDDMPATQDNAPASDNSQPAPSQNGSDDDDEEPDYIDE